MWWNLLKGVWFLENVGEIERFERVNLNYK